MAKSQKELAESIGVGERTYTAWLAEGCPGSPGNYSIREVIEWAKANKWCKSSDPLLAGDDSDQLERYRGFKADLAEIDVQERRREMIHLENVRPAFITALGFMKTAGEKLDRQYGNEALAILTDAWEQAMDHIQHELSSDNIKQ